MAPLPPSSRELRLILDVMGGDKGLATQLEGLAQALPELEASVVLVGDEAIIRAQLNRRRFKLVRNSPKVTIVHAPETIEMTDSIRSVRNKPQASMNVACAMAAEDYKARGPRISAMISAGHSGGVMAASLLQMGRLRGVERPAIAVKLPTLSANGCVLIDSGANVDCKPEHLRDFAIMGSIFSGVEHEPGKYPRVGVLSNGEEKSKGTELTRASCAAIEALDCFKKGHPSQIGDFIGYAEGKEIFKGQVDVVVADGFVGNVVLKSLEGLGSTVVQVLKSEARSSLLTPLGFLLSAGVFRRLKRKLDYAEYGAAPLLGVAGYVFICHGRSNSKAIKNALLRAQSSLRGQLVERLEATLASQVASPVAAGATSR